MTQAPQDHSRLMDSIYRYQRYIYDATRKFYLFGRDRVIREMQIAPGDRVLEMGCGTARNLIMLARRNPEAYFYGIDASSEMLKTAEKKVRNAGLQDRIMLRTALAEEVDYEKTFQQSEPFDAVMFSYALSMIPSWREAIQCGFHNLKPGGWMYIVDFWDQQNLPAWFRFLLTRWLALFHVRHEPEMLNYLETLEIIDPEGFHLQSIFGRYALKTQLRKRSDASA